MVGFLEKGGDGEADFGVLEEEPKKALPFHPHVRTEGSPWQLAGGVDPRRRTVFFATVE